MPYDCADRPNENIKITRIGAELRPVEAKESELLLGRFRYYVGHISPYYSKFPVSLSSERMELWWKPNGEALGLRFSSYTSRGSHIFWSLQRKFGFREAEATWTAVNGVPGTFILTRRRRLLPWPTVPFRAVEDRPLRIVDILEVGQHIAEGDRSSVEGLLEETFPRTLFRLNHFEDILLTGKDLKHFYTVTLKRPQHQVELDRSTVFYAHLVFTYVQWHFGFREAKAVLRDESGAEICRMELHTLRRLRGGAFNSTSDGNITHTS